MEISFESHSSGNNDNDDDGKEIVITRPGEEKTATRHVLWIKY